MEDRQGQRSSKTSIVKGRNVTVPSINIQMDNHLVIGGTGYYHQETNSKIHDRYAGKLDRASPIVRYFHPQSPIVGKLPSLGDTFSTPVADVINANYRSAMINHYASSTSGSSSFGSRGGVSSLSPLSAMENLETPPVRSPQIYGTPVKVDEEVIVMDGILISSVLGGAKTMRSALDSGSGGGLSSGKNQYRTEICRSWEDSGSCRFSHKCQFAHGKEELRPARIPVKTKSKFGFRNSHSLTGMAATTKQSNLIDTINKTSELTRREGRTTSSSTSMRHMNIKPTPISTISNIDWSPEDDGIKTLIQTTKREDVNKYISGVLYGSTTEMTKKSLPVFAQLCSDEIQQK